MRKQKRDTKTKVMCPETKRPLTTTELYYGHCFSCPEWQQKTCQKMIKQQQDESRKRL